jgi:hypothetical protein
MSGNSGTGVLEDKYQLWTELPDVQVPGVSDFLAQVFRTRLILEYPAGSPAVTEQVLDNPDKQYPWFYLVLYLYAGEYDKAYQWYEEQRLVPRCEHDKYLLRTLLQRVGRPMDASFFAPY